MNPAVLHLAPHPDDELLGAPATLLALQSAGWRVVNYAVSLGRSDQHQRRRAEVAEACRRAGFELIIPKTPHAISSSDDLEAAERRLATELEHLLTELQPKIVASPSPHDRHPGHELVARAVRRCLEARRDRPAVWWMWGLWGELPFPTLMHVFDRAVQERVAYALQAHAGELARNDYRRLLEGRALANRCLGVERVFGFGAADEAGAGEYAELLCEAVLTTQGWRLGSKRILDPRDALADPSEVEFGWWLEMASYTSRERPVRR